MITSDLGFSLHSVSSQVLCVVQNGGGGGPSKSLQRNDFSCPEQTAAPRVLSGEQETHTQRSRREAEERAWQTREGPELLRSQMSRSRSPARPPSAHLSAAAQNFQGGDETGQDGKQQKQNTLYSESVPYTKSSKSDLRLCHILCLSWQAAEVELHDPAVCGVCEQEQASLALKSFIRRKTTQLRYQSLKARLNTHLSSGGGGGAARTQTVISLNWQLIWASVRLIALIFLQDLNCSVCCRRVHVGRVGATSPRGLHDAAH